MNSADPREHPVSNLHIPLVHFHLLCLYQSVAGSGVEEDKESRLKVPRSLGFGRRPMDSEARRDCEVIHVRYAELTGIML